MPHRRDGHGIIINCENCGREKYIDVPEMWVPKREITKKDGSRRIVYFCKSTCKWAFDDRYEAELEQKKQEAAKKRHEARKKNPESIKKPGRKKMTPEQKAKAAEERAGKVCMDCRYAQRDHYGFLYCTHQYKIKPNRNACGLFRQKDEVVHCG